MDQNTVIEIIIASHIIPVSISLSSYPAQAIIILIITGFTRSKDETINYITKQSIILPLIIQYYLG